MCQSEPFDVHENNLFECEFLESIDEVSAHEWNQCVPSDCPYLRHEFLNALEQSKCVSDETGWQPIHIVLRKSNSPDSPVVAALPLYLKFHSWGEFIFDWQWEHAYMESGRQYYPKLVSASPFTGLPGPKLLISPDIDEDAARKLLTDTCMQLTQQLEVSSLHLLFLRPDELEYFRSRKLIPRRSNISYVWDNQGYESMEDFLATLSSRKRKKIRHERNSIVKNGINVEVVQGTDMTDLHWHLLERIYTDTVDKYGSFRYLNHKFFMMIRESMPENLLFIMAERDGRPIAGALFYQGGGKLYGRYWGALEEVPNLHFEVCYYSAIEHCILNGFDQCNVGVQGSHKLSRGFLPEVCHSAHMFNDEGFSIAIRAYAVREAIGLEVRREILNESSAYAKTNKD